MKFYNKQDEYLEIVQELYSRDSLAIQTPYQAFSMK